MVNTVHELLEKDSRFTQYSVVLSCVIRLSCTQIQNLFWATTFSNLRHNSLEAQRFMMSHH